MKAQICNNKGNMGIEINGTRYAFSATRSFRPESRILKKFSERSIHFYNLFPSGIMTALQDRTVPYSQFGPVWVGDHAYNWDNLKKQCDEIFGALSESDYVSLSVHLDPPTWYVEQHPELVDHWEQMIQNLGSEEWKKDAVDYMKALIDKADEWYPDRVYAIWLMCGGTTEWYSYKIRELIEHPTELHRETYKKFMADPDIEIPSVQRLHAAEDGVIRSSIKQKDAIDFWKYVNDIVTDTILYFAKAAKEHTKRTKLVGLFYAHIFGECLDSAVYVNYNRPDKLLKSEDVDMIFAPASYILRKLDSTSGIRVPVDSATLHNKLYAHEIDSATHLLKNIKEEAAHSHAGSRDEGFTCSNDTIAYMRREVSILLAKNQGYWWFDMFSGYYDDDSLMNEIELLKNIQEKLFDMPSKPVSQVTEMLDINSNYHISTNCYYPMPGHQNEALNLCTVPWDQNMTYDLFHSDFDEDRYKLYIFPALFAPENNTVQKLQELRNKGKSMLYMHAPYYAADNTMSVETMKKYTGIEFERVELADNTIELCFEGGEGITYHFTNKSITGDCWYHEGEEAITPVFAAKNLDVVLGRFKENGMPACGIKFREDGGFDAFSACAPVPKELLCEIYKRAGVFFYADKFVPVYTNSSFESVYSYEGGAVTLYRPEKSILTDCITGERFKVDEHGTEIIFKPRENKMFYVS